MESRPNLLPTIMDNSMLILGGVLVAITATYLVVNTSQRDKLLSSFKGRGRKVSSAGTPPRDVAPEKAPLEPMYRDVLPPSRREALYEVAPTDIPEDKRKYLAPKDLSEADMVRSMLPIDENYLTCTETKFTPLGFSTEEIKALGDFPDYATLSGVPLPQPYKEFDISKALPRPYRPFRWNYHQTMCKSTVGLTVGRMRFC